MDIPLNKIKFVSQGEIYLLVGPMANLSMVPKFIKMLACFSIEYIYIFYCIFLQCLSPILIV